MSPEEPLLQRSPTWVRSRTWTRLVAPRRAAAAVGAIPTAAPRALTLAAVLAAAPCSLIAAIAAVLTALIATVLAPAPVTPLRLAIPLLWCPPLALIGLGEKGSSHQHRDADGARDREASWFEP